MSAGRARGETVAGSGIGAEAPRIDTPSGDALFDPIAFPPLLRACESIQQKKAWDLYFPAMLGPTRTKTRRGVKVRVRELELPPNSNDRLNRFAKAKWAKAWRTTAYLLARARGLPRLERVRASAIVYRSRIGQADAPNDFERLKSIFDGLRDADVLPNDTYKHLELGTIEEKRGEPGILVVLEEIER